MKLPQQRKLRYYLWLWVYSEEEIELMMEQICLNNDFEKYHDNTWETPAYEGLSERIKRATSKK